MLIDPRLASRAGANRFGPREVDDLVAVAAGIRLAEIEFHLPVGLDQLEDRRKRTAHLAAKAMQRTDGFLSHQLLGFGGLEQAR